MYDSAAGPGCLTRRLLQQCDRTGRRTAFFLCAALLSLLASPLTHSLQAQQLVAKTLPNAPSFLQTPQAEADAQIQGTVADITGSLVPGATVALQEATRPPHKTATDAQGAFLFVGLPAGRYQLSVVAPNLKEYLSPPFAVLAGQHLELPAISLSVVSAEAVVVNGNSVEVAEEELHTQIEQRTLGIFPNFYTSYVYQAAPLDRKQKARLTYRVLADPVSLIGFAITAEIETNSDTFPRWGRDAPSYGKRFGAAFGDSLFSRGFDSALFPILFHQDPRYFYMGPAQPTRKRLLHALQSGIITRGDNGRNQPNYSHLFGNASAGALSSVYHPNSDSPQSLALYNTLLRLGFDGLDATLREFIFPRLSHHGPNANSGQPAGTP